MVFETFFINSAIPLVLAFVLWLNSSRHTKAKRFLSLALLNAAVTFFITYQYLSGRYELYSWLHPIGVASILFIYPSFYQYVYYLTGEKKFNAAIFLPGIVFSLLSIPLFWGLLNMEGRVYFLSDYRTHTSGDSLWLQVNQVFRLANVAMILFQIVFFYIKSNKLLSLYHIRIANVFSSVGPLKLNKVKALNVSFIVTAFACISFYMVNPVKVFGTNAALEYPFYLLAFIFTLLGAIGISQLEAPDELIDIEEKSIPEVMDCTPVDELFESVERYFDTEKPYLNPELTILNVASAVASNRTYVSACINRNREQNFSQFVNSFRVNYAKTLFVKYPNYTISEISHQAGFGSLSALSRAFHDFEHITPSEYRNQVLSAKPMVKSVV